MPEDLASAFSLGETLFSAGLAYAEHVTRDKPEDEKKSKDSSSSKKKHSSGSYRGHHHRRRRSPTPESKDDYDSEEESVRDNHASSSRRPRTPELEDGYEYDEEPARDTRARSLHRHSGRDRYVEETESHILPPARARTPEYRQRSPYRGADEAHAGEAEYEYEYHSRVTRAISSAERDELERRR